MNIPVIKRRFINTIKYIILISYSIITIFPLYWTFVNSFRTNSQIFTKIALWPEKISYLRNYELILAQNIPRAFLNSVTYTALALLLLLFCVIPASFFLSTYRFKLAMPIHNFFILGIVIPRLSILIATFRNYKTFGFLNHQYPIVFCYTTFEIPISIFLIVSFMQTIPRSIVESAVIDGCGSLRLMMEIIAPMSRNGILTVIILSFVSIWNEYAYTMVLLTNRRFKTLTIALASAKTEFIIEYGMLSAGVVIAVIPVIIVYSFLQDKIISGMVAGAVKG